MKYKRFRVVLLDTCSHTPVLILFHGLFIYLQLQAWICSHAYTTQFTYGLVLGYGTPFTNINLLESSHG